MVKVNDLNKLIVDIHFILKVVVLIFCCIASFLVSSHGLFISRNQHSDLKSKHESYLHGMVKGNMLGNRYISYQEEEIVMIATYGYLVVIAVMVVVYIFDESHKLLECLLLIAGGVCSLAAGIICMLAYTSFKEDTKYGREAANKDSRLTERLVAGIFALFNGIIMIVDGVITALKLAGKM